MSASHSRQSPSFFRPLPLLASLLAHGALFLTLSPGHEEEHTIQLFEGVLEFGESGDGHAEEPHVHAPHERRQRRAEPEPEVMDGESLAESSQKAPTDDSPLDVSAPGSGPSGASGAATELSETERYLLTIVKKIQDSRSYPRESILREEEGVVVVAVTIARDGTIQGLDLAQASPFDALNRSALEAIRKSGPFLPLPSLWDRAIRIRIPLNFQLERR